MVDARDRVLVVGAGPSGLFAACELARHGVLVRVVERDPVPHRQVRATALQAATLEVLHRAGVVDAVLASSEHLGYARVFDPSLRMLSELSFAGVGCEWEFQCSLPQWSTEAILAERFARFGGAVERGVEVVGLEGRDDGVLVRFADGAEAPFERVIGAGGAHSAVRASMGERLEGSTYPGTALVADVRVRCDLPRDGSALCVSPEGYVTFAPVPGGRWVMFLGDVAAGEAADVIAAVARRLGDAVAIEDVAWSSTFRMQNRVVPRMGDGRRFLLGDESHLSSPFGGEGLNAGLFDACDLAWKLALTMRGRARPSLLDTFVVERSAVDAHVLEVADRIHGLARAAISAAATGEARPPATPEQIAALARARSMADVSYAGSPLVGSYGAVDGDGPQPGARYPGRCRLGGRAHHLLVGAERLGDEPLQRFRARWSGLVEVVPGPSTPGALLVRPDGIVGFRAASADAPALGAIDAHLASYLVPG